ncbi:MAG: hypothetical protein ABR543_17900 [Gemmatimonadaceae bacterium]
MRAPIAFAGVWLALLGTTSCLSERDRLDVPVVSVAAIDTVIDGERWIRALVTAEDASGIVLVRVLAKSAFDTLVDRFNVPDVRNLSEVSLLPVTDSIRTGTLIEVEAQVLDNQDFTVSASDTVVIR